MITASLAKIFGNAEAMGTIWHILVEVLSAHYQWQVIENTCKLIYITTCSEVGWYPCIGVYLYWHGIIDFIIIYW